MRISTRLRNASIATLMIAFSLFSTPTVLTHSMTDQQVNRAIPTQLVAPSACHKDDDCDPYERIH
jgi:hypothetical protein